MADEVVDSALFTVYGLCNQTFERWAWTGEAASVDMAEQLAHEAMHNRGLEVGADLTLAVCAVIPGPEIARDAYRWADPSVHTQEEMDALREEGGWLPPSKTVEVEVVKINYRIVVSAAITALMIGLILGLIA